MTEAEIYHDKVEFIEEMMLKHKNDEIAQKLLRGVLQDVVERHNARLGEIAEIAKYQRRAA